MIIQSYISYNPIFFGKFKFFRKKSFTLQTHLFHLMKNHSNMQQNVYWRQQMISSFVFQLKLMGLSYFILFRFFVVINIGLKRQFYSIIVDHQLYLKYSKFEFFRKEKPLCFILTNTLTLNTLNTQKIVFIDFAYI